MSFRKEIEQYLEQISTLEESFRSARDLDTLPVSFFSISLDVLNQLKDGLYDLESLQLQMVSTQVNELAEFKDIKEVKDNVSGFWSGKISKETRADLTKSLTINQRFMFLKNIFKGNEAEMNETFAHLNTLKTLEDALAYLDNEYPVQWRTEQGIAFKELLEKHFV